MNEIAWRVKKGWVYLLGIFLILGTVFIGLQEPGTKTAGAENASAKSPQSTTENVSEAGKTTASNQSIAPVAQSVGTQTKKKTTYKYVTTTVPAQTSVTQGQASVSTQNVVVTPPPAPKNTAQVKITGLGTYTVEIKNGDTAFDALKKAASQNGFSLEYKIYSFGVMVSKIGATESQGTYYWALYYNGDYSSVGAGDLKLNNKDVTEWRYESW